MEGHCTEMVLVFNIKKLIAMRKNQSTPLSIGVILEEDKGEEEIDEDAVDDGITSVDSLSTTPTGVETPDAIDLLKAQRKKPEKLLYQVLEEKEERRQPGQLLGTSDTEGRLSCRDYIGPVQIRHCPGRTSSGRKALFATKRLEPGELILVSNPLVCLKIRSVKEEFIVKELVRKLIAATRGAPREGDMARLQSLLDGDQHEKLTPDDSVEWVPTCDMKPNLDSSRCEEIIRRKRFQFVDPEAPWEGRGCIPQVVGLWLLPAFAGHSCAPNSQHLLAGNALFLRASRNIADGEEISVTYFHDIFCTVKNRQKISQGWTFVCKCERCVFEQSLEPRFSTITDSLLKFKKIAVAALRANSRAGQASAANAVGDEHVLLQQMGSIRLALHMKGGCGFTSGKTKKVNQGLSEAASKDHAQLEEILNSLGLTPERLSWMRASFQSLYFYKLHFTMDNSSRISILRTILHGFREVTVSSLDDFELLLLFLEEVAQLDGQSELVREALDIAQFLKKIVLGT